MKKKNSGTPESLQQTPNAPRRGDATAVQAHPKRRRISTRSHAVEASSQTEPVEQPPKKRAAKTKAGNPISAALTKGALSDSPGGSPTQDTARMEKVITQKRETPIEASVGNVPGATPRPFPQNAPPPAGESAGGKKSEISQQLSTAIKTLAGEKPTRKLKFEIPPILFEGDEPSAPAEGPGRKFAVSPESSAPGRAEPVSEKGLSRPAAGGRLAVTARDPHCLFAYWDLSPEQQQSHLAAAPQRQLVLRVRVNNTAGPIVNETAVHDESRHWFVHVSEAGATYISELGYYLAGREWVGIVTSQPASTPPETFSQDRTVQFAEMPSTVTEDQGQAGPWQSETRLPAPPPFMGTQQWRQEDLLPESPAVTNFPVQWTAAQEAALEEIISSMLVREEWFDSFQLVEALEQRRLRSKMIPSPMKPGVQPLEMLGPSSAELISPEVPLEAVSSPLGLEQKQPRREFWFNVNAELIVYGATEPTARVTIGGRRIKLRPDGTFSYRFALPDGKFALPVEAISTDEDRRQAELRFSRETRYEGEVGAHPQDRSLRIPAPENVT